MSILVSDLKAMLAELPDTMRVVCAYPTNNPEEKSEPVEIVASHSVYIESFENERGEQEVALVVSVFDPVPIPHHLEKVRDSVPPTYVLGED
jgi:hypothetical protein